MNSDYSTIYEGITVVSSNGYGIDAFGFDREVGWEAAMKIVDILAQETYNTYVMFGDTESAKCVRAIELLFINNDPDDFTKSGRPTAKAFKKILGVHIPKESRDLAYAQWKEMKSSGESIDTFTRRHYKTDGITGLLIVDGVSTPIDLAVTP